ncbi:MAG: magnetochrome domain-containing protein [Magnetococcales bacterium]|nr:magnetochrome domain-containing protein [Magnetococcales bacterium]
MKFGMWIMATGFMLGTGLFLMAVLDVDPWKDHRYSYAPPIAADAPSPHVDDAYHKSCSSCHQIINTQKDLAIPVVPPIVNGALSPHRDGRETQACSRCHRIQATPAVQTPPGAPNSTTAPMPQGMVVALTTPLTTLPPPPQPWDPERHERFRPVRFQGRILAVVGKNLNFGRNNVNILINDGVNRPSWINLAPEWYLQAKRCHVFYGLYVKGTAFAEVGQPNSLRYGQTLAVNGQYCRLRNSHLEGLWNPSARRGENSNEEADFE